MITGPTSNFTLAFSLFIFSAPLSLFIHESCFRKLYSFYQGHHLVCKLHFQVDCMYKSKLEEFCLHILLNNFWITFLLEIVQLAALIHLIWLYFNSLINYYQTNYYQTIEIRENVFHNISIISISISIKKYPVSIQNDHLGDFLDCVFYM